jgi:hypothetical protein
MAFNLAPEAEVYRNPDPLVEEAIAVIEAVARVPQQVHKWGHAAVKAAWPNLYDFYYGTIAITVTGPFQPISLYTLNYGYIHAYRVLVYSDTCADVPWNTNPYRFPF